MIVGKHIFKVSAANGLYPLLGEQPGRIEGKFSKTAGIECFHNSDGVDNDGGKDDMKQTHTKIFAVS